jgi:uncharacterized protein YcfJ
MTHALLCLLLFVAGAVAGAWAGYRVGESMREPCVCERERVP